MWVESWGRPYSEDSSERESSLGIMIEEFGITWTNTHDHSKWIVLKDRPVICIGDINLMDS